MTLLKLQVLLEQDEMVSLFESLGEFSIYITGCVTKKNEARIPHATFLKGYEEYLHALKQGKDTNSFRRLLSSVFTVSEDHLETIAVDEQREIKKPIKPIIQLQQHQIGYSVTEKKFRPMVLGKECIPWGIQFAYPKLVQNPDTQQIESAKLYPNARLFHTLQRYIRHHTIPTPFKVEELKVNVPIRLGKGCLPWINTHPQLVEKQIHVN